MATRFLAPSPLHRVAELARRSPGVVAVPYIGRRGATLLPLHAGSVLVTRVDAASVKSGTVDPRELLRYVRRGVLVHGLKDLHAKVYVFGRWAVVGSANLSNSSLDLLEAAVETNEAAVVKEARRWVLGWCADPIGPEYLKSLVQFYPQQLDYGKRRNSRSAEAHHSRVWVASIVNDAVWTDETKERDRATRPKASKEVGEKSRLEAIEWLSSDWRRMEPGDRLVQRTAKGRGFEFDPPSRIVRIEPLTRGALVYLERQKHLRKVSSVLVRNRLKSDASALTFTGDGVRLVRQGRVAAAFSRLWPTLAPS